MRLLLIFRWLNIIHLINTQHIPAVYVSCWAISRQYSQKYGLVNVEVPKLHINHEVSWSMAVNAEPSPSLILLQQNNRSMIRCKIWPNQIDQVRGFAESTIFAQHRGYLKDESITLVWSCETFILLDNPLQNAWML